MKTIRSCPACGVPLPPDAPAGLCPQCLLKSDLPTLTEGGAAPGPERAIRSVPIPGRRFGDYLILRLLGQGGMGEVYEAEHVETGRRIALKVMSQALASEQDRKRFLREGRMAASVNHPNVVYIHGSEEIGGAPVIAMELVHGGTLKDWLKREGPLPAAKAVEAALQVIAGLEAAQTGGVLHRDIKPANCFVEADGTVKVGDFGLSVSTLARGESLLTATGSVLGTPAYASPEQLRGEELDVTSDIYSVGATLYHLLTGKTPFSATDFVKLITEVLDKAPEAPHSVRSEVPAQLSRIVLRCLAKDRRARFQTYNELREALLPFRATEAVPARPARRFLAALLDDLIAYGPSLLFLVYWSFDPLDNLIRERTLHAGLVWFPFYLWYLFYYVLAEGCWGAALGKTICGLRVVGPDRQVPGLKRALLRTVVYMVPFTAPSFLVLACVPLATLRAAHAQNDLLITDWAWVPLTLALFVTMRRRNGYAAVHDLVSGTRVIVRPRAESRPKLGAALRTEPSPTPLQRLGPYEIQGSLWKTEKEELLQAFDPALCRKVWIHLRPSDAEPLAAARRDLNRPGRLRWLNGGQTDAGRWDAYEAADGTPLLALGREPQPWSAVRFWLLDLAEEIGAALKSPATAPTLSLPRVWVAANGRAMLLDFGSPGLPRGEASRESLPLSDSQDMQRFLDLVANTVLSPMKIDGDGSIGKRAEPVVWRGLVPLHAQGFLVSLSRGAFDQAEFIVGNLHSLIVKPAQIVPAWRAASLVTAPTVILLFGLLLTGMDNFETIRWHRRWADVYPGKPSLRAAAQVYQQTVERAQKGEAGEKEPEIIRAYLVTHFGELLTNEAFWANRELTGDFPEGERALLRQAMIAHAAPAPESIAEAERSVRPRIQEQESQSRFVLAWLFIGTLLAGGALLALVEGVGCAAFRQSPVLRLFGIAIVDRHGLLATRPRLLWRWLVVWGPMGAIGFMASGFATFAIAACAAIVPLDAAAIRGLTILAIVPGITGVVLWLGAIIQAVLRPQRGMADVLAGTRLVPR